MSEGSRRSDSFAEAGLLAGRVVGVAIGRLARLAGREADRLSVDRHARAVKALSLLALVVGGGAMALEAALLA